MQNHNSRENLDFKNTFCCDATNHDHLMITVFINKKIDVLHFSAKYDHSRC